MSKEVLIDVHEVSRYYGDYCAVNNISFRVHRGEVIGFLGPNGAGKTTSMQIITGVLAASEGQVTIANQDILDKAKTAKAHIGFLPEVPPLYPDLTVDEYLHYASRLRKIARGLSQNAITEAKQRCGLSDVGHRLIRNLSKGYQQRVGIAQAIIHKPSVVILDEPTSGLDPIQIREIRDLIRELGQDHSVILSTHILPEVQTVCDRVIIINQGKLVLDEKLKDLNKNQGNSFRVAFQHPPEINALNDITHVEDIKQLDENRFQFFIKEGESIYTDLNKRAVDSNWGLYELIPDTGSLEETFMQLTQQMESA